MGTGIDQRSARSCSTGGSTLSCQASCCTVPVISTPPHSASRPRRRCWDHGPVSDSPAPITAVPRRMRQVCALVAVVVVGVMLFAALTLKTSSTGVVRFGVVDQFAIAGLGLVLGAGLLALGRSQVDADADGIRFRNIALGHELPWTAVRAVAFDRKSPWACLLLRSGDEVALRALQAVDNQRTLRAVKAGRNLLAAAQAREPARPP